VANEAKPLEGAALRRAEHALAHLMASKEFDRAAAEHRLDELMGGAA
jgi:hypothetical protein